MLVTKEFTFEHESKDLNCTLKYDMLSPKGFRISCENSRLTREMLDDLREVSKNMIKYYIEFEHGVELC